VFVISILLFGLPIPTLYFQEVVRFVFLRNFYKSLDGRGDDRVAFEIVSDSYAAIAHGPPFTFFLVNVFGI
jgi:hypothetical protein